MNAAELSKPPAWYMVVAGLALVWNLLGVAAYLNQLSMDLAALPDNQRLFYASLPAWATAAFAIAVFGGLAGSIGLLLKKRWSIAVLTLSFAGIVVQVSHSLLLSNGLEVFGPGGLVMPVLTLGIGAALVAFAVLAKNRAWL